MVLMVHMSSWLGGGFDDAHKPWAGAWGGLESVRFALLMDSESIYQESGMYTCYNRPYF